MKTLHGHEGRDRRKPRVLRIVLLEGDPTHADLIETHLAQDGLLYELERVGSRDAFSAELRRNGVDVILADHAPHDLLDPLL